LIGCAEDGMKAVLRLAALQVIWGRLGARLGSLQDAVQTSSFFTNLHLNCPSCPSANVNFGAKFPHKVSLASLQIRTAFPGTIFVFFPFLRQVRDAGPTYFSPSFLQNGVQTLS